MMIQRSDVLPERGTQNGKIQNCAWINWEIRELVIAITTHSIMLLQTATSRNSQLAALRSPGRIPFTSAKFVTCGLWSRQKELSYSVARYSTVRSVALMYDITGL